MSMRRPLVLAAFVAVLAPAAHAHAQETDHLACMKVTDTPQSDAPVPVAISDILEDSFSGCVIKKVKLVSLCVRVSRDNGDDPHAAQSAAEAYGCYKVKCAEKPDGSVGVDDAFGSRIVTRKSLLTLCAPAELPPDVP